MHSTRNKGRSETLRFELALYYIRYPNYYLDNFLSALVAYNWKVDRNSARYITFRS